LWASFGGTQVFDVIDPHTGYLTSANYWEATVTVTATSTTETLVFGGHTNLGYFQLDDVSLVSAAPAATAPEPASLTLLATGALGLLGYRWRRRGRPAA
jgi:hypothetical protein